MLAPTDTLLLWSLLHTLGNPPVPPRPALDPLSSAFLTMADVRSALLSRRPPPETPSRPQLKSFPDQDSDLLASLSPTPPPPPPYHKISPTALVAALVSPSNGQLVDILLPPGNTTLEWEQVGRVQGDEGWR